MPPATLAANLLTNPGFESGSLAPWSCTGGLGSVVSTPVHGGTKALAAAASGSDTAQCTQTVAVQPSTAYSLTAWVRGNYVYLGVAGGASTWTPSAAAYTMVISVLERRAEIGLRRSLGATRGQIRLQFLTGSLILATLGLPVVSSVKTTISF